MMQLSTQINGTDFSDLFEYAERSETMRRVQGKNGGVNILGGTIIDDLAIKYDLRATTKPARPGRIRALMAELVKPTCSVRYYSWIRNSYVTQTMRVENLEAVLGLLKGYGDDPILGNISITFTQQ